MIPILAASLLFQAGKGGPIVLPKPSPATIPNEVRDWTGFKYLPAGTREVPNAFPGPGDWSGVKGDVAANAAVWRLKVVILDRVDRVHERGPGIVWPGHHGFPPYVVEAIKHALPQFRALVADATGGAVELKFDVSEEAEALTVDGDLSAVVERYLTPRINGGAFQAEDGIFRGPYQSVIVLHPVGGESVSSMKVQDTPVSVLGLPDVWNEESDGILAVALAGLWETQAATRFSDAGSPNGFEAPFPNLDWRGIVSGVDATTEQRLRLVSVHGVREVAPPGPSFPRDRSPRGEQTIVSLTKDPQRGSVLVVKEAGAFRGGGFALPIVNGVAVADPKATPTLTFWMMSEAKDPIVIQIGSENSPYGTVPSSPYEDVPKIIRIGVDVPFVYDNLWHRVKVDLRRLSVRSDGRVDVNRILIGPDPAARARVKTTLGPIVASFSDFEATNEAPDPRPSPEASSATAGDPEARARWAASAGPGEERRALMKDPVEAVRANATAAALARPDPMDEQALIENSLYTFEPTIYTPALRALAHAKTLTARDALKQALRIAAADRARGLAAEILAESGDPKLVPLMIGLNQSRTRAARIEAVRALGSLPGSEAALMRMAYLAQDDPEVKLATTLTADPNDDYQGRKLLWSAVNEPSDAVRLESLRRLSASTVTAFQAEGLKGIRDDSVGVRVGLLATWTASPTAATLPAIRIALADKSPRVRAAAVAALAANPSPVGAGDVPFDDPDPRVQLALLRLATAKGLKVPSEIRERWRKAPDPAVRAEVG